MVCYDQAHPNQSCHGPCSKLWTETGHHCDLGWRENPCCDLWLTIEDCDQAALGGNLVKRALGWPNEMCDEKPSRVKKLEHELKEAHALIETLQSRSNVSEDQTIGKK